MIHSVTGPLPTASLGRVLVHEHVVQTLPGYTLPGTDEMIPELQDYLTAGGSTIVSQTTPCLGRDVVRLRDIAEGSGVAILAATGRFSRELSEPTGDPSALAGRFVVELTEGIEGTGIRAAVIGEVGTSKTIPGRFEYELFQAVALAHLATGAPIGTHTYGGRYARWQLAYLISRGVNAERISVGHSDLAVDATGRIHVDLLTEIADTGAFVSFDTIGNDAYSTYLGRSHPSDHERAWAIARLVERGYASHILLSHDIGKPEHLARAGGFGYTHVIRRFLPMLEQAYGISADVSRSFLTTNAVRWLTGAEPSE